MSGQGIVRMERGLCSLLQVLTGPRASGSLTVRALAGTPTMPANTYGIPVITSAAGVKGLDRSRMIKTVADTVLSVGGEDVAIVSMIGGPRQNLPAGTDFVWDGPAPAAVEARSALAADLAGGLAPTGEAGALKRVLAFEQVGKGDVAKNLWSANGSPDDFPAAIISWEGSRSDFKPARGSVREIHKFRIYVVVSRLDGDSARCDEGKTCLQAVKAIMTDRAAADGESISNPPIMPGDSGRLVVGATSYVYWAEFELGYATRKRELRSFADWTKTHQTVQAPADDVPPIPPNAPDPLPVVDDSFNMPT